MDSRKPILVTGSHRSGSTWVGNMIASSTSVGYIQEPFNLKHRPGICRAKFDTWFPYVVAENQNACLDALKNTLAFQYGLFAEIAALRTVRDLARMIRDYTLFSIYRRRGAKPLVKDPIAVFSAEWLEKTFDMDVIVLIRHPAAFVSSLKRLNWTHPFEHFLRQPLLLRDYLAPFEGKIREYANKEPDIIDQGILLWNMIHYVVLRYRGRHKNWIFMRHEDISRDPEGHFKLLFDRLGLEFTPRVQRTLVRYSNASNPAEAPEGSYSIQRDSMTNIWNWKNRLTREEVRRIRAGVEEIAKEFYSDRDW